MDTNNSIKSNKTTSRLRRFAIGTVAAVAGLGLAGAGNAAAAEPTTDTAPPAVETEAAADVTHVVEPGGFVLWNGFPVGTVTGGYVLSNGTGVIDLSNGSQIDITSATIMDGYGGFIGANYQGSPYFGELEAVFFGGNVYELGLESMFGMELEIGFLTINRI